MRYLALALSGLLLLSGCAAERIWATDEAVAKATYRHAGPTRLTLFTMINNKNNSGAHTSLMINGSQRIIFDPAGSFKHPLIPERNDVVFGITDQVADGYTRYHARETFRVRVQELDVSPELAERAIRLAMANGPVSPAQCSLSTSGILAQLFPGKIKRSWFPHKLADQFAELPGVEDGVFYEYDSDDNSRVLQEWNPDLPWRTN